MERRWTFVTNKLFRLFWSMLISIMVLCVSTPVFASDVDLSLPISQQITSEKLIFRHFDPDKVTIGYKLSAMDHAPMPDGASDGEWHFSLRGNGACTNLNVSYTQAGEYHYILETESFAGVSEQELYAELDVAEIIVSVIDRGGALQTQTAVYVKEAAGDIDRKMPEIMFSYTLMKDTAQPQSPDQQGPKTPAGSLQTPQTTLPPESVTSGTSIVKTGDESHLYIYSFIIMVAAAAFVLLVLLYLRRRKEENNPQT